MFAVRWQQRLQAVFSQQRITSCRALTVAANAPRHGEDVLVDIENPYKQPPKACVLCNVSVDFKNTQLLSQFISPHTGRIYGRHITGLCGRKQREIAKAIKKAQSMGFMSVTHKHPQFMKDPNICGIRQLD